MTREHTKVRTMPLREAKARLSEAVNVSQGTYVLIMRHGRPAAVLIGVEELDALEVAQRFSEFSVRLPLESPGV